MKIPVCHRSCCFARHYLCIVLSTDMGLLLCPLCSIFSPYHHTLPSQRPQPHGIPTKRKRTKHNNNTNNNKLKKKCLGCSSRIRQGQGVSPSPSTVHWMVAIHGRPTKLWPLMETALRPTLLCGWSRRARTSIGCW